MMLQSCRARARLDWVRASNFACARSAHYDSGRSAAMLSVNILVMESSGAPELNMMRSEVLSVLSDQGTEKAICNSPLTIRPVI